MKKTLLLMTILLALFNNGCGKEEKVTESSPVTYHKGDDPEVLRANAEARKTFRHFWKEYSWDFNRIIPAVEVGCVKLAFSDDPSDPDSFVEHMWVSEINFDGEKIQGVLINDPNQLRSVKKGDTVECSPDEIGDWMCVVAGKVYGAYSVQVIRSRMSEKERKAYDAQWGLAFPPPYKVRLPPENEKFEAVIATKLKEQLKKDPTIINITDDSGRTPLHFSALCGRKESVRVLLDHGADPTKKCPRGWTPKDYAKALGS